MDPTFTTLGQRIPISRNFGLTDAEVLAIRPHGKGALTLTPGACRDCGTDAGNRSMRKAGRTRWNDDDLNTAAETTMRLMVLGEFLPVECYASHGFGEFPYVLGNDGEWIKRRPEGR